MISCSVYGGLLLVTGCFPLGVSSALETFVLHLFTVETVGEDPGLLGILLLIGVDFPEGDLEVVYLLLCFPELFSDSSKAGLVIGGSLLDRLFENGGEVKGCRGFDIQV